MEHQVKAYAFIAPSLLILTVFVFIPLAGAIGISLMNIDIYMKNISFAGIANYIKMFQDEQQQRHDHLEGHLKQCEIKCFRMSVW